MTIDDVTDPECLIWIEKVRLAHTKEELVDLHHAAAKRRNAAIISAWKQYQPASRSPVTPDDKPAMAPDDNWRVVEQFIADERARRFQTTNKTGGTR